MSRRDDDTPPYRAKVPADVERPDQIVFGLTVRQVAILTIAGLVLYGLWWPAIAVVSPMVFVAVAIPYSALAFFLAVGRRDGISLDTWLLAALRHRNSTHRMVSSPGPVTPPPTWIATAGPRRVALPARLRLPARGVTGDGVIDLGPDGTTALVAASTVCFALRSDREQAGLVAGFGRWLNSLDSPAQIVVRARRVDLTVIADAVGDRAAGLPHPALEDAARSHIEFLDQLGAGRELLYRDVTVAVRDTRGPAHTTARADEAARALAGCEITARVLDPGQTATALAVCLDPNALAIPDGLAPTTAVIHGPAQGEQR